MFGIQNFRPRRRGKRGKKAPAFGPLQDLYSAHILQYLFSRVYLGAQTSNLAAALPERPLGYPLVTPNVRAKQPRQAIWHDDIRLAQRVIC